MEWNNPPEYVWHLHLHGLREKDNQLKRYEPQRHPAVRLGQATMLLKRRLRSLVGTESAEMLGNSV